MNKYHTQIKHHIDNGNVLETIGEKENIFTDPPKTVGGEIGNYRMQNFSTQHPGGRYEMGDLRTPIQHQQNQHQQEPLIDLSDHKMTPEGEIHDLFREKNRPGFAEAEEPKPDYKRMSSQLKSMVGDKKHRKPAQRQIISEDTQDNQDNQDHLNKVVTAVVIIILIFVLYFALTSKKVTFIRQNLPHPSTTSGIVIRSSIMSLIVGGAFMLISKK